MWRNTSGGRPARGRTWGWPAVLLALAGVVTPAAVRAEGGAVDALEEIATGEYWYAMLDEATKPQGYAYMRIERPEQGLAVHWELKLALTDGTYEETRSMALDRDARLTGSSYRVFGNLVCAGTWTGERWVVETVRGGETVSQEADRPLAGAITGMGFVLAAAVPRREGGQLSRPELDEANGLAPLGETTFYWRGRIERPWEGETLTVDRVVQRRGNGSELPLLVTQDGRILEADWGGGTVMVLRKESTKHLFLPPSPALAVVAQGTELILEGELGAFTPQEVYAHFTEPDLLADFWAPEARIEARVGGAYELTWPGPGWALRGRVRAAEPGRRLAFTWSWAHAPETPERVVTLDLTPRDGGGCRVTVTQGPYGDTPEDGEERKGHVQGWQQVFARLRALR